MARTCDEVESHLNDGSWSHPGNCEDGELPNGQTMLRLAGTPRGMFVRCGLRDAGARFVGGDVLFVTHGPAQGGAAIGPVVNAGQLLAVPHGSHSATPRDFLRPSGRIRYGKHKKDA